MKYTIPLVPPSNNQYIGRNKAWEYREAKQEWAQIIAVYCRPRPEKPLDKVIVRITYYFPTRTRRDPDNYSGKFILDGLTSAGVIVDDSFNNIRLELDGRHDKENPRTEIIIKEVAE